ncbi:DNA primase [Enterococcus asini]|uniref:DNA primase n=1 Tax=Enterococcus asini TaxID=57732 RepID=UPI00288FA797|nr:DNA primase [Enterococcus asini]MDT2756731.1 DNA primase [Enterococcus asini]
MARIPDAVIDEIREKVNIVDIVGQYVQLKKAGKNYSGLCPFHNEKTPSFSVAEDKQFYHCFGCGRGGNVFSFLQEIDGISFPEAVAKVADFEQIPLAAEYREVSGPAENSETRQLIALHEKAQELYHHMLMNTAIGEAALAYLHERGLDDETIAEFGIGFAPNQRQFLEQVFQNEGFDSELYEASGLFLKRDDGSFADRFYQRIMFPIRDPQGKTIAFSGRFFKTEAFPGEDQPKYLNSPETLLFNKRMVLFNFDKARGTIRKESTVFLFEGFMDVIAAWRAGVKNGIASMGTSLTQQQVNAMERLATTVVICYDGDNAGIEATQRGIALLKENSRLKIDIARLPEGLDPDEYVQKYGGEAFAQLAEHGRETVFSFQLDYYRSKFNLANENDQLLYVETMLKELTQVDSLIQQDHYLTQLATEFHLQRETLQQQLATLKQQARHLQKTPDRAYEVPYEAPPEHAPKVAPITTRPLTQGEKAEQQLLYRLFNEPRLLYQLEQAQVHFLHEDYEEIYRLFKEYYEQKGEFEVAGFVDYLDNPEIQNKVITIVTLNLPQESTEKEIQVLLRVFEKTRLADKINEKVILQQEAGRIKNTQLELELAIEIINLRKQLKQTDIF